MGLSSADGLVCQSLGPTFSGRVYWVLLFKFGVPLVHGLCFALLCICWRV